MSKRQASSSSHATQKKAKRLVSGPQSTLPTPKKSRSSFWKPKFLEALRDTASIWHSCKFAGIERSTAYRARDVDEQFRKDWNDALEDAGDQVEYALRKRAIDKDTLAGIFWLKNNREKYREQSRLELSGPKGGPIQIAQIEQAASEFDSRLSALMVRVTKTSVE